MFVRKLSGTGARAFIPADSEPIELDRIDGLDHEPDEEELKAAQARYEEFLATRDFSTAGDLLPFFARDFFHDTPLDDLRVNGSEMTLSFKAEAWVESDDEGQSVVFNVEFDNVVWLSIDAVTGHYGDYIYGEIDALDDRINSAAKRFGGDFHSLTIEAGFGTWIQLVFRSVAVTPVDSIKWLRVLRDAQSGLTSLYGLDGS